MSTRRAFLKHTGAFAFGGLVLQDVHASNYFKTTLPRPGLQLFTFFNVIDDDVTGTLKKVADLGYVNIESAFSRKGGYYGMKPKEFASMLGDLGLSWKAHHVLGAPFKMPPNAKPPVGADGKPIEIPPMRNLRENFQELVDEAAEGKVEYLVCANTPIGTVEEIKGSIDVLNRTAESARKAGLTLAFHNHDGEFRPVEGKIPYDLLLSETSPDLKMELDLAWATKGGQDPVALFKKHPGRFHLWHVKDIDQEMKTVLPVGKGSIDFKRIFDNAEVSGMKYYFVEHDMPQDAFGSITFSVQTINKIINK